VARPRAAAVLVLLAASPSFAETARYAVKLRADLERRVLHGDTESHDTDRWCSVRAPCPR